MYASIEGTSMNTTDTTFIKDVLEASLDKHIIVDFYADWCQPCKMVAPVLEEIANDNSEILSLAKVNIDENPELTKNYAIKSVPTILVLKNGEVKGQLVGAKPKFALNKAIMDIISQP